MRTVKQVLQVFLFNNLMLAGLICLGFYFIAKSYAVIRDCTIATNLGICKCDLEQAILAGINSQTSQNGQSQAVAPTPAK